MDIHTIENPNLSSLAKTERNIFIFFDEHKELIAALLSGLLILTAWLFKEHFSSTIWIVIHICAFVIGGYAKAKEGITETIHHRELNVEKIGRASCRERV